MKSADEIRTHRNALRDTKDQPCSCAADGHFLECQLGAAAMQSAERVLSWVLDEENADFQRIVDIVNQRALEIN
jgi:hypothetical protein